MRLDKFLSDCGYGTRKEVKQLIRQGYVSVGHDVCTKDGFAIDEYNDVVTVDEVVVQYQKYVYLMLYKPAGYLSANEDSKHPTVFDLISEYGHRDMFCVGRLDLDTEGLLLICDNGDLAHRLLAPKYHVAKQYEAWLKQPISDDALRQIEQGIVLEDGYQCMPAHCTRMQEDKVLLEIMEGKFHQVKRMFQAVGNQVVYLKRLRMGSLVLDPALQKGEYRELTAEEVAILEQLPQKMIK